MPLGFSSKGDTLAKLFGELSQANIKPLVSFQVQDWNKDRKSCLKKATSTLEGDSFIVRSSCNREDGAKHPMRVHFFPSQISLQRPWGCNYSSNWILGKPILWISFNTTNASKCANWGSISHDPNTYTYRVVNWTEAKIPPQLQVAWQAPFSSCSGSQYRHRKS